MTRLHLRSELALNRLRLHVGFIVAFLLSASTAFAANQCPTNTYQQCVVAAKADDSGIWANFINSLPPTMPLKKAILWSGQFASVTYKSNLCYELFDGS